MIVGLSDSLKSDKALLDEQIATAFLTGIVAATDRFSNNLTSSRVMTMAAQLMSAGANQQLIASKLEEAHEIGPDAPVSTDDKNSDGTVDLSEGESTKVNKKQGRNRKNSNAPTEQKKDDGSLTISHEKEGTVDEVGAETAAEEQAKAAQKAKEELEKSAPKETPPAEAAEQNLANQLATVAPVVPATPSLSVADLQKDLAEANEEVNEAAAQTPEAVHPPLPVSGPVATEQWQGPEQATPSMGGTLNATTEQAAEDKRRELDDDRNRTILSHNNGNNYVGDSTPTFQSPLNSSVQPASEEPAFVDPFKNLVPPEPETAPTAYAHTVQPPEATLADLDKRNRVPHEEARAAVDAAFGAVPFTPAGNPLAAVGAQPLGGPVSHDAPAAPQQDNSLPPLPPMPDFSTLPPLPPAPDQGAPMGGLSPEKLEDVWAPAPNIPAPTVPQSNDPGQFKIPGQN
jgi:hypothetical protein